MKVSPFICFYSLLSSFKYYRFMSFKKTLVCLKYREEECLQFWNLGKVNSMQMKSSVTKIIKEGDR